jgi:hypothetical protein
MRIDKFKLALWFCHILAWVNMIFFRFMLLIARVFLMLPERILSFLNRKSHVRVDIIDVLNDRGVSVKQKFIWLTKLFWEEFSVVNGVNGVGNLGDDGELNEGVDKGKDVGGGGDDDELDKMMQMVNKNIGQSIKLHGISANLMFDLLSTSTIIIIYVLADVRRQKIIEKNGDKYIANGRELLFNMVNFD